MNRSPSITLALVIFLTTSAAYADDHTSLVAPGAMVKKLASGMQFYRRPGVAA